MPDLQQDVSQAASQVKADAVASATHAENRLLTTLKDNAGYVALAGVVLLAIVAALIFA